MIIYKITHIDTKKCYIGQSISDPKTRWRRHKCSDSYIGRAIQKYGQDAFVFEIIDTAETIDELNTKEIEYIEKYNSIAPFGFNIEKGGRNASMPDHVKKIISKTHKGKTISEIQKKAISDWNKNKIVSSETREKIRNSRLGKKASEETRKKIGDSNKNKIFPPRTEEQKNKITYQNLIRSKDNNDGVGYVKRYNAFQGRVVFKGIDKKRMFSIKKYGEEKAYFMAKEFRDKLLDSLLEDKNAI